ncbi:unnamed protein product [Fusarium graminearum]|nr:unnamed protein product [Fusarium graminearum]
MEGVDGIKTYLVQNLVSFDADELALVVEMNGSQLSSLKQLRCKPSSDLHNGLKHLVVTVPSKEDLAGVHLV